MMPRAGARIGDRLGGEHGALEGLGRADVGLRRSRLDCDADAGAGEIDAVAHHPTLLDQIVDHFRIMRDQVRRRVCGDLLHQRRTGLEADDHLVPGGALEGEGNIAHSRYYAHAGKDGKFGCARRTR